MRWNVDTPEGLIAATHWQSNTIEHIRDQGRWVVPRSGSVIVIDKTNKQAIRVFGLLPEPSIKKVFEAMGWTWVDKTTEEQKA